MTHPSSSHQPSPARSMSDPSSGQCFRPGQACTNAPGRKRGGQPGNQNARKTGTYSTFHPGLYSATRSQVQALRIRLKDPAVPLDQVVEQASTARQALPLPVQALEGEFLPALRLFQSLSKMITRAYSLSIPSRRLSDVLSAIAHDPFGYFERAYKDCGISRDADSFFPVSEKSVQNSPLPSSHPRLATNLTDAQWTVLAPLIPPDPHLDWLTGDPPVIIAANRWGFNEYYFTGEFNDFVIMKNYHQILKRFPALCAEEPVLPSPNGSTV
jgi:hypothetical protein